ncbi:hypothetical protein, partial [Gordonia aichiensis]
MRIVRATPPGEEILDDRHPRRVGRLGQHPVGQAGGGGQHLGQRSRIIAQRTDIPAGEGAEPTWPEPETERLALAVELTHVFRGT